MTKTEDEKWTEEARAVVLPAWLTKCLPDPKPILTLKRHGKEFFAVDSDDVVVDSSASLIELYDRQDKADVDLTADESLNGHGGRLIGGAFFVDSDVDRGSSRLLLFVDDDVKLCLLKSSYSSWLKTYQVWSDDRNDPFLAFEMIQCHPIFWSRYKAEPTLDWETSAGYSHLYLYVMADDDGKWFMAELGSHVESDYMHFYHDYRLDVSARSLDSLYVEIAKAVDKHFDRTGDERDPKLVSG